MTRAFLISIFLAALALPLAHATTLTPMTPQERFLKSDLVCEVVVQGASAEWLHTSGQNRIVTFYRAAPSDLVRGALTAEELKKGTLTIALPGGVVDGVGQRVHAVPTFKKGERWLVHLGPPTGPGQARGVIGFERGATKLPPSPEAQELLREDFAESIQRWIP